MSAIVFKSLPEVSIVDYILVPALILDLDGTVRTTKSGETFPIDPYDVQLVSGIKKAVEDYRQKGYLIVSASNQGGVAHGKKTPDEVLTELNNTIALFDENPFHISQHSYNMANGSVKPYCYRSLLRKPDIGMLVLAEVEALKYGYIIDWDNSLMVGDRNDDSLCASNAGISFSFIWEFLDAHKPVEPADPIATTLDEAIDYVLPRFVDMEIYLGDDEDKFAAFCHSQLSGGIGMNIRNELKLWIPESVLHQYFLTHHNLFHADDMSDLIIRGVYRKLKPQPNEC